MKKYFVSLVAKYEKFGDQAFPGKGSSEFISNKIKNLKKKTGLSTFYWLK